MAVPVNWTVEHFRSIAWSSLEYEQSLRINRVKTNPSGAFLMISEPHPTFTFGRNAVSSELLWNREELEKNGAKTAAVKRGGKWTYHGPGQIVIYPIVHLPSLGYHSKEVKEFVEDFRRFIYSGLLELFPNELSSLLTHGEPFGLYLNHQKLASFGFAFDRGVASSGVALYYLDQSLYFRGINPCGVSGGMSTSLAQHLSALPSWEQVSDTLTKHIKNGFSLQSIKVL